MVIKEDALKHWIDNFYGYGSWLARMWFINYEDDGGDLPEEVAEKLNYFFCIHAQGSNSTLCDIREFYRHMSFPAEGPKADLFSSLYDFRFGGNAIQNGIWKNLIAFVHGYRNEDLPHLLDYQINSFALPSVDSQALIKLYPLPSPHNHAWYYSWLDMPQLGFLKTRALYEEYVFEKRISTILQNISTYRPELVLMYGMNNINALKKSIQGFFSTAKFKTIKAVKQQIPQHHQANLNGTTLVITTQIPTLRHNRIETGFDWEMFGKKICGEKNQNHSLPSLAKDR